MKTPPYPAAACSFRSIKQGECFWFSRELYIKTSQIDDAVHLQSGSVVDFDPVSEVIPAPHVEIIEKSA